MRQKVDYLLLRARKLAGTFQAELRRHYSSERMSNLLRYIQLTPSLRAILVAIISPFPCLIILMLIDVVPMAPPEDGSAANYLFWARDYITIALMTRVILEQFRVTVPGLHINSWQVVAMPIIASGGAIAFMTTMSSIIGFPLPFALVVGIPVWFVVLIICFVVFFGRVLQRDRALLRELLQSIVVLILQVLLTFVYPAYLYGFIHLGESGQHFYIMLLLVIKTCARNWINFCMGNRYDLMPQVMIFNVDVFNALYVSSSMQNSRSIVTMLEMVARDAVLGWISITDVNYIMKDVNILRRKIPSGHPLKSASFIEIALQIIKEDPEAREHLVQRRYSAARLILKHLSGGGPRMKAVEISAKRGLMLSNKQVLPLELLPAVPSVRVLSLQLSSEPTTLCNIFSAKERQRFLHKSARVLFTTEFVILVEYTEVIAPLIFTMYTLGIIYLPNHDYYPHLQSFYDAGLEKKTRECDNAWIRRADIAPGDRILNPANARNFRTAYALIRTRPQLENGAVEFVFVDLLHDPEFTRTQRSRFQLYLFVAERKVGGWRRRSYKLCESFQVELRGHYSSDRMKSFDDYSRSTSALCALIICAISPFPSLLLVIAIDDARMAPPEDGSAENYLC